MHGDLHPSLQSSELLLLVLLRLRAYGAQVGLIKVPVRRTGNLSLSVHVDYSCRDGLARKGEDYEALIQSAI